jgi:hypothetical protein
MRTRGCHAMSDFPPGSDEDEDVPIDDAVDFDVRLRQAAIHEAHVKRKEELRTLIILSREIAASLQSFRDGLQWVDERTRKPLP